MSYDQINVFFLERYIAVFTDRATRMKWIFPMKTRSQVVDVFDELRRWLKAHHNVDVSCIQGDSEYDTRLMISICREHSIAKRFSAPYSPNQNGLAERANRSLGKMIRTTVLHAVLPLKFYFGLWPRRARSY